MEVKRAPIQPNLNQPYPKPGEIGGKLIREVMRFFKSQQISVPIKTSHILIAISGGSDSTALAHLLIKYGRRVVAAENIELLHINHGWRAGDSDQDEDFVRDFAKRWGVPFKSVRVSAPGVPSYEKSQSPYENSRSWEEVARSLRKEVFRRESEQRDAWILTGHQKDDLAETVLWRLLTGAAQTLGGGIALRHGIELRPFLTIRKQALIAYLHEEKQAWRQDSTNEGDRFMRSRMRTRLFPEIEAIFPKAIENLAQLGLDAQARDAEVFAPETLVGSVKKKPRLP